MDNRVGDVCKKFSEDKNRSLDAAEDESAKVSKKGFLLTIDDPYGVAVLRVYAKEKKTSGELELPFLLPYDDPATKAALENYLVRAGGDTERTFDAKVALRRCK